MTEYPELHGLKAQKAILSQFRSPQVQNQGVGRARLPLKALGEDRSVFLLLFEFLGKGKVQDNPDTKRLNSI